MSVYGEYPAKEHRTQFASKGKGEHIAKVNIPYIAYRSQHVGIEIPQSSKDHVVIPNTIKLRLILTLHQHTRDVVL